MLIPLNLPYETTPNFSFGILKWKVGPITDPLTRKQTRNIQSITFWDTKTKEQTQKYPSDLQDL